MTSELIIHLITKIPNPGDNRSQLLLLTQDGERIQASLAKLTKRAEQVMMDGITEADMQTFYAVAQKMAKNLEESHT
ncbi:hypothetical protein [Catenovulum sediminis]|uniref:hypothetical protein n=1 Tax=Catenovulum sediminis TaxID=1740262 RepID=UPI00163D556B|nr:hypothetical protein [Catenovulum sediminis]